MQSRFVANRFRRCRSVQYTLYLASSPGTTRRIHRTIPTPHNTVCALDPSPRQASNRTSSCRMRAYMSISRLSSCRSVRGEGQGVVRGMVLGCGRPCGRLFFAGPFFGAAAMPAAFSTAVTIVGFSVSDGVFLALSWRNERAVLAVLFQLTFCFCRGRQGETGGGRERGRTCGCGEPWMVRLLTRRPFWFSLSSSCSNFCCMRSDCPSVVWFGFAVILVSSASPYSSISSRERRIILRTKLSPVTIQYDAYAVSLATAALVLVHLCRPALVPTRDDSIAPLNSDPSRFLSSLSRDLAHWIPYR